MIDDEIKKCFEKVKNYVRDEYKKQNKYNDFSEFYNDFKKDLKSENKTNYRAICAKCPEYIVDRTYIGLILEDVKGSEYRMILHEMCLDEIVYEAYESNNKTKH